MLLMGKLTISIGTIFQFAMLQITRGYALKLRLWWNMMNTVLLQEQKNKQVTTI